MEIKKRSRWDLDPGMPDLYVEGYKHFYEGVQTVKELKIYMLDDHHIFLKQITADGVPLSDGDFIVNYKVLIGEEDIHSYDIETLKCADCKNKFSKANWSCNHTKKCLLAGRRLAKLLKLPDSTCKKNN